MLYPLNDRLRAGKPHLFRGLHQRRQRRQHVFGDLETVDGNDGAVVRHAPAVVAEGFNRRNRDHVRNREDRGKRVVALDQAACRLIDGVHIGKSACAGDQIRIKGDSVCGECVLIALEAQLADGFVVLIVGQNRDSAVSQRDERVHRVHSGLLIVDCDGAERASVKRAECIGVGAEYAGDVDQRHLLRRIVESSAEEEDADQLSLVGQLRADTQFIHRGIHVVQFQRIPAQGDLTIDGLDEFCKEGVVDAFDEQRDGIRAGPYEISRARVGDIVQLVDRADHFFPRFLADIGMVVEHAGNSADRNAAVERDVLDVRHSRIVSSFAWIRIVWNNNC